MTTRRPNTTDASSKESNIEGKELRHSSSSCSACETGDVVTNYCENCLESLCDECAKFHRRHRSTKDHRLVDVTTACDGSGNVPTALCDLHQQDFLFFCKTCGVGVCDICKKDQHHLHELRDVSECSLEIKTVYCEKLHTLQAKLKLAKERENRYKHLIHHFEEQCTQVQTEMVQRRSYIEALIQQILDKKMEELHLQKGNITSAFTQTRSNLEQTIKQSETVIALPTVEDAHMQLENLKILDNEVKQLARVLNKTDILETSESVKAVDGADTAKLIERILIKYLNFTGCQTIEQVNISNEITNKENNTCSLALVSKTNLEHRIYMSRNICADELCHHIQSDKTVSIAELSSDGNDLSYKQSDFPKAVNGDNTNILTISKSRHVIISRNAIHLCNNLNVIHSEPHTRDGYFPDQIAYVDEDKFITLCSKKRLIRYHCAHTLACLNTHTLRDKQGKEIVFSYSVIFHTSDDTLLIKTGHTKLEMFTADGVLISAFSLPDDYEKCDMNQLCIGHGNEIFGVDHEYGQIHMYSLNGKHTISDLPDDVEMTYFWCSGTDDKYLYLSYTDKAGAWIAKYLYSS